jgi:hypothetical protein
MMSILLTYIIVFKWHNHSVGCCLCYSYSVLQLHPSNVLLDLTIAYDLYSVVVTPSDTTINVYTSYTITIDRTTYSNGSSAPWSTTPVPANSNITIIFPSQFNTTVGYVCPVYCHVTADISFMLRLESQPCHHRCLSDSRLPRYHHSNNKQCPKSKPCNYHGRVYGHSGQRLHCGEYK